MKAYSAGLRVAFSETGAAAVPFFKRALEIDPEFAMAHAALGLAYGDSGESALSAKSITKAYELRDRASDRERFFIMLSYGLQVTGNLETAQQNGELWAQTYPRDVDAHGLLSLLYQPLGRYETSIEHANIASGLDPDFAPGYVNRAFSCFYLDRPAEAENALQRASERKLRPAEVLVLRYYIAFLRGDQAGMEQEVDRARGKPGAEDWIAHSEALVLARSGHVQQARAASRRAVDSAQRAGRHEKAAVFETGMAMYEAFSGNAAEAQRSAAAALDLSNGRDVEYGAAFALALSGDLSRSQALANDLEQRFPEDTMVRFSYVPALRALSALNHGEPARAVDMLRIAAPYDLAVPGLNFLGFFGSLYPAYVRGQGYLATRKGSEAAMEFQKILDHRGIVFADPVDAMARLQLGRAFALAGDTTKAKTAYQDFLTLWKDADPGIPVLEQARAEYARLVSGFE